MPAFEPVQGEHLKLAEVLARFDHALSWLARTYVNTTNSVHYMHDKYAYERLVMALHDYAPERSVAFGIAGLSVVADSLSAIAHARVEVVRDATGLVVDYVVSGEFPRFGHDDDRADHFARDLVHAFGQKLRQHATYRNAEHTQSVLTVTSNALYGRHTGNTPDGRRRGEPLSPAVSPPHGRDRLELIACACSVANVPYDDCQAGISLTETIVPSRLGATEVDRVHELTATLDALFDRGLSHVNVSVLTPEVRDST